VHSKQVHSQQVHSKQVHSKQAHSFVISLQKVLRPLAAIAQLACLMPVPGFVQ
jgi:hypothetical protein